MHMLQQLFQNKTGKSILIVLALAGTAALMVSFGAAQADNQVNITWVNDNDEGCHRPGESSIISNGQAVWTAAIVNQGPDSIVIEKSAFHDPQAGCEATAFTPAHSALAMTGKTSYAEGESGTTAFAFDLSAYNCGRVQVDAEYITSSGERVTFLGEIINYGVDCQGQQIVECIDNSIVMTSSLANNSVFNPGESRSFTVTLKNTGNTKWYHGNVYQLRQTNPGSLLTPNYGHLPNVVQVNDNVTFDLNITAPTQPGSYSFEMQMIHLTTGQYIRFDNQTCPPPAIDTFFGQKFARTIVVNQDVPQNNTVTLQKQVRNLSSNQSSFQDSVNANAGDTVEFKLAVKVTQGTINNINLSDSLPSGLTYVPGSLTMGSSLSSIAIGNLSANATRDVFFKATVDQTSVSKTMTNTVTLTHSAGSLTDSASVTVTVNPPQNNTVTLQKQVRNLSSNQSSFQDSVNANAQDAVEFKITVLTSGTVSNINVSDYLPSGLSYIQNSLTVDGYQVNNNLNSISLGTRSNSTTTILFRANVAPDSFFGSGSTTLTNTASLTSSAGSYSDSAQVVVNKTTPPPSGNFNLVLSKKAFNLTQGKDATTTTAKAGDVIQYTLRVQNTGSASAFNFVFEDNIADILELANLTAYDTATFDASSKVLRWSQTTIPANSFVEKTFKVTVKNPIPTNTDYLMTNVFGNTVTVPVARPFTAPPTGNASTLSLILALMTVGGVAGWNAVSRRLA